MIGPPKGSHPRDRPCVLFPEANLISRKVVPEVRIDILRPVGRKLLVVIHLCGQIDDISKTSFVAPHRKIVILPIGEQIRIQHAYLPYHVDFYQEGGSKQDDIVSMLCCPPRCFFFISGRLNCRNLCVEESASIDEYRWTLQ